MTLSRSLESTRSVHTHQGHGSRAALMRFGSGHCRAQVDAFESEARVDYD